MTSSNGRPRDPRGGASCRIRYTAAEAYEAREYFAWGWSLERISHKMKIPRPVIYKWCVLGLHHPDAIPPEFHEASATYIPPKLAAHERVDQAPRSLIRQWRAMFMADTTALGRIQLELNALDVPVPMTGLESNGWAASDLIRLLLGSEGRSRPYPQGHESMPSGYMRWWKNHSGRLAAELEALEKSLRGGRATQADMDLLAPILGRLVDDLEPEPELPRPVGFMGELQMITPFSPLKPMPLSGGITRGCVRSAIAVANALMAARVEDKRSLSVFVEWTDAAATRHEHQTHALEEDVVAIADCCGFSRREARRILRLAQELRFLRGAGKKGLADAEMERVLGIFDARGVVARPDTSFSQSQLHVKRGALLTGRFDRAARRVRLRERRETIKNSAHGPSEARPL